MLNTSSHLGCLLGKEFGVWRPVVPLRGYDELLNSGAGEHPFVLVYEDELGIEWELADETTSAGLRKFNKIEKEIV